MIYFFWYDFTFLFFTKISDEFYKINGEIIVYTYYKIRKSKLFKNN